MKLKAGKKVQIQSYKHDSSLHRVWTSSFVIDDTAEALVTGNQATKVIESDGRSWYTKEPAICYFYEKEWFNIIAMLKRDGIHYYCNISSPYLYDGEAIKYIDYDLDIKVFPNGKLVVLDQKDFDEHSMDMHYSEEVQRIIYQAIDDLKVWIEERHPPFDKRTVKSHYEQFKIILEKYKAKQESKNKIKQEENEE